MRTVLAVIPALVLIGCASVQPQGSYVGTSAAAHGERMTYYKDKPGQQLAQPGGGAFRVSR